MISIITEEFTEHRKINFGNDGPKEGNQMTDQCIAILFGWGIGIYEKVGQ